MLVGQITITTLFSSYTPHKEVYNIYQNNNQISITLKDKKIPCAQLIKKIHKYQKSNPANIDQIIQIQITKENYKRIIKQATTEAI